MFNTPAKDSTVAELKNSACDMRDDVQNLANQAGRKMRRLYDSASSEMTHAGETVTNEIRTHPVRSSLVALGVGVVLGALLRR